MCSARGVSESNSEAKRKLDVCDKRRWIDSNWACGGIDKGDVRACVLSDLPKKCALYFYPPLYFVFAYDPVPYDVQQKPEAEHKPKEVI